MGIRVFVRTAVVISTAFAFVACSYDFTVGTGAPSTDAGGTDALASEDAPGGPGPGPLDEQRLPEATACSISGCSCASGATCNFYCGDSICIEKCGSGTTCNLICVQGNCHQDCGESSSCNVDCTNGGCTIACKAGSYCTGTCAGGGCVTQCAEGAHCKIECTDPSCVCSGAGCE